MRNRKIAGCAAVLLAVACALPGGGSGQPYTPKGNPWEAGARDAGATETKTAAGADAKVETKGDGKAPAAEAAPAGGTVLEQLDAARARVLKLEAESAKLKTDNASLTAVVDQLKKENQNLAQLADSATQTRARLDHEMDGLRQQVKDADLRARQLADDVLQERILRVRVERELILAKVQEAENAEGGN